PCRVSAPSDFPTVRKEGAPREADVGGHSEIRPRPPSVVHSPAKLRPATVESGNTRRAAHRRLVSTPVRLCFASARWLGPSRPATTSFVAPTFQPRLLGNSTLCCC